MIKKIIKNAKGYSLAELMIAVGLTGLVGAGMVHFAESNSRMKSNIEAYNEIQTINRLMAIKLYGSEGCEEAIKG